MDRHISVEPFPPGEYLKEFMDGKGWKQDDLAAVLGRSRQHVNRLLQGKTGITPETANELSEAFGTSVELWMNLQMSYELSRAAKADREIKRRALVYEKAPVRELVKRGWIGETKSTSRLEEAICGLFGTTSIEDDPQIPAVAAKKGTTYKHDTAAQIAWYRRAQEIAESAPASRYSKANFNDGLRELMSLAAYPEDARRIPKTLGDMGIRLVLIQHLNGTKIDGVAFWLDENTPAVALSLRYDRIDNLWHTLMHELVHILNEDVHPAVDNNMMSDDFPEKEREVNEQAAALLIPPEKLRSFIKRVEPYFYRSRIIQFAQARGVHPGLVVGQLQYRKKLGFQHLRELLPKIRSEIMPAAVCDGWGNLAAN
jgi:HTH-type transcriptional regulator/antitoxin HigA